MFNLYIFYIAYPHHFIISTVRIAELYGVSNELLVCHRRFESFGHYLESPIPQYHCKSEYGY